MTNQGQPVDAGGQGEEPPRDEYARHLSAADQLEYARFQQVSGVLTPALAQQTRIFIDVLLILGGWASVTVEVFFRRSFGTRYFSPMRYGLGATLLGAYIFATLLVSALGQGGTFSFWVLVGFLLVYLARGAYLRFDAWYRDTYDPDPWHSKSFGSSGLFRRLEGKRYRKLPAVDEWFIYRIVEPCVCLFAGWVLFVLGVIGLPTLALSNWLYFAGFALLFRNNALYMQSNEKARDLADARIEAMFMSATARGATPPPTGYTPPRLPVALDRDRNRVPDALEAPRREQRPSMDDILAATLRNDGDGQGRQS